MDLHLHAPSNPNMQALCFSSEAMSEGGLLSIESHRSVPAPFLTKTYQLVDDPTTDHIVSWGEDESTFVVWRPPEFARDLLPNYFKHNNFSSFVRQLNTYGFRKIVPDRWEFANEFFRKGEKHLLCEIHRRKTAQNNRSSPTNSTEDLMMQQQGSATPWSPLSSPIASPRSAAFAAAAAHHVSMQQAAAAAAHSMAHMSSMGAGCGLSLSDENERLRRDNTLLLSELTRMRKLYHDVLLYVQRHNLQAQTARSTSHSELSTQASSFHIPSSHRSLVYHAPTTCNVNGIMQRSNCMDSPTSRLMAAADSSRSSDNTASIPFAVPVTTHALQLPATARTEALLQSSYCNVDIRNPKSAASPSPSAPPQSALSVSTSNQPIANEDAAACGGAEKSPPKLFGVPLQSSKKRVHEDDNAYNEVLLVDDGSLSKSSVASLNMLKSVKTSELTLELKQPMSTSMHAPWLKFNASRDEQVYN